MFSKLLKNYRRCRCALLASPVFALHRLFEHFFNSLLAAACFSGRLSDQSRQRLRFRQRGPAALWPNPAGFAVIRLKSVFLRTTIS